MADDEKADNEKIIIEYAHPNKTLDEWEVSVPTGWDLMNGAARRQWAIRYLRRWNSTYTYKHFRRK